MSAAIGSLSFLRELFSDDNFIDDTFQVPHQVNTKPNIVRIKRLKRGVSESADTLISWLVSCCLKISVVTYTDFFQHTGIFDALEKKFLKSIIISIYLDPTKQEEVAETYIFSLSYTRDKKGINLSMDNSTDVQNGNFQINCQSESTILPDTVSYFKF